MTSFADDFRAEAKSKPGDVVRRYVNGWSFCLSYGPVDPLVAANLAADAEMRIEHKGRDVTDTVMERLKTAKEDPQYEKTAEEMKDEWMFSAKLFPPGRSSTEADWKYLGMMVAAVVRSPKVPATISNTPGGAHYWAWRDS